MKINNLDELEKLIQLVKTYALDNLSVDGISITKTQHPSAVITQSEPEAEELDPFDDELWS